MKISEKTSSDDFQNDHLQLSSESHEGIKGMSDGADKFCDVYRELAAVIGESAVIRIWKNYAGMSISFPKRLLDRNYIRKFIQENMDVMKAGEMAGEVGLSERRVRQIMHEIRASKDE